jgi:ribosomal protein S18 acetylase RimI-like enzyme
MKGDQDFWRIRELIIETYPITARGFNWEVRRWDGQRFYNADPGLKPGWQEQVQLWETEHGRLVAAVHPEDGGDAHLEVHPDFRYIEEVMFAWAEEHLSQPNPDGTGRRITTYVYEYDVYRQELLRARDYQRTDYWGQTRYLRLGHQPLPRPVVAEGYTLRATRPEPDDDHRIADLLNAAFGRDFHNAAEFQTFTRLAPSFVRALDLVAEAPDGSFAAYVGIPYDQVNQRAIFEPVCTHPDHRRRGLALALMHEGLLRLRAMGALEVTVDTGSMEAANRLYDSVGFTERHKGSYWRRTF